jgi:hypothetical protein
MGTADGGLLVKRYADGTGSNTSANYAGIFYQEASDVIALGLTNSDPGSTLVSVENYLPLRASNIIADGTSNTLGSIFTTGGNVGMGTTAPGYALHVIGTIYSSGDIMSFSDVTMKENINVLDNCLDKVKELNGVSFTRKDSGTQHIGFLAQEVEAIFPELVMTDNVSGYKSVAYGNVTAVLLECIKELSEELNNLKARLN